MKWTVLNFGTLKVTALEMIMGVSKDLVRQQYAVDKNGNMRIGMNALVIVSTQSQYLEDARTWIERLDRAGDAAGKWALANTEPVKADAVNIFEDSFSRLKNGLPSN